MVHWLHIIILAPTLLMLPQAIMAQPNITSLLENDFNPIGASSTSGTPIIDIDDLFAEAHSQEDTGSQVTSTEEEDPDLYRGSWLWEPLMGTPFTANWPHI